jgi:hypothetical protein
MQAEKDSARTAAANQDSLGDIEGTYLQFILLADRIVNKASKVI